MNPLEGVSTFCSLPLSDDFHAFEIEILIKFGTTEGVFEMRDNCFIPRDKGRELTSTK
jgi:hypothetical protein